MRILLVEDDESIREVFKLILETEASIPQMTVDTAGNGDEALKCLSGSAADLILLDLTLPNEHGFEVFKRIKDHKENLSTPVIAVTAHNQKELEKEAIDLGFSGYVTKPFDFEQSLFPLMKRLLSSRDKSHAA